MDIKIFDQYNDANKLLSLFVKGYNMHKNGRPDKFVDRDENELCNILKETLKKNGVIIATENDNIIGFLIFNFQQRVHKSLWVDEVIIDEHYRRQGIGKKLIEKAEQHAINEGCKSIELCCWAFNNEAEKFYNSLDYGVQRTIFEKIF